MNFEKLNDWMQIIGLFLVVASLIFVGMQLRQEDRAALLQVSQADETSSTQIDLAIAEHAELWAKSNRGEPLSEVETIIMNRLVTALYRRARLEALMRRSMGAIRPQTIVDFAVELYENPGARKIWEAQAAAEASNFELLRPDSSNRQRFHQQVFVELETLDNSSQE
jgi:hypothetical protein